MSTRTVSAYAANSPNSPLVPMTIPRRDLRPQDLRIDIAFAGVCHSDIHHARGDWRDEIYPLVPGHEIAGVVSAIGSDVTMFAVGDRVGVGCMVDSCGHCASCRAGKEQYCEPGNTLTYGVIDRHGEVTYGGYSTEIVVDEHFVVGIPDGLDLDEAAPLLCAGITSYSPLRRFGAGPGKRVAVVGLGGLGHMAVKLAHAMGAEVTVLSQSLKKQEDGLRLGADHYYATSDPDTFTVLAGRFDLIVNTVSAAVPLDDYLRLLAVEGTLVNVGAPAEPLSLNAFSLLTNGRSFTGSMIGGIAETQEMMNFCALHGLGAEIEVIAAEQINDAFERVLASDVRYRFVIEAGTFAGGDS
jgi:alcohol dehydrogenase (NADP+)